MNCRFTELTEGTACERRCGVKLRRDFEKAPVIVCHGKPLLGEWVKAELEKRGLTEEWYKQHKAELGLSENCGCGWRQKFLDWVGTKSRDLGLTNGI